MTVPSTNRVLVAGATGTVGSEVVRALGKRAGVQVRALVRAPARARALPGWVEPVFGDLGDAGAVARALAGVSAAFYVAPHEPDEEHLAQVFVSACEATRVRLVFVGVHVDGPSRWQRAFRRLLVRVMLGGHYGPKFRLSERIRRARTEAVLLLPTNFYQNDELFRDELLAGEFVQPFSDGGVNRVDVRDLGDAAARALVDRSVPPGVYPVVGPASLSGSDAAAVWGRTLGREVRDTGHDFARFEQLAAGRLEGKKREDFIGSYRLVRRLRLATNPRELAATCALLGRPPRGYDDYARDAAARWRSRAASGSRW